jgi:SnoaL-like domain
MAAEPLVPDPELWDRLAIRETFEKRLVHIDCRDPEGAGECLAEDAEFVSTAQGSTPLVGKAAIVANTRHLMSTGALGRCSHHGLGTMSTLVDGTRARSIAFAVVHLAVGSEHSGIVLIRGVGYEDDWVRDGPVWLIRRHVHRPLWQCQLRQTAARLPGG